ncbi:MAG TPA: hypothetical protein VMF06_04130 [Candidatus Limnocylindria bacterium]|jgi:hypothetical protein|nr:hypothetical protein [Candidatus Limnocylindria bacterium]
MKSTAGNSLAARTVKSWLATAALCLATYSIQAQSTTHLTRAMSLVSQLRAQGEAGHFFDNYGVEYNQYGAAWANSYITVGNPSYVHAVCSNFYIRLMTQSYPGWTAKGVGFSNASPSSEVIHDAIEANACQYVKVSDFANWHAGDVLVVKYFDDSANTGHTMILEQAEAETAYDDGTVRWSVKVIDCSSGVHSNDSRVFPNYTSTGVGSGYLYVYTLNGHITQYSWKQSSGSTLYPQNVRHMTLGRLAF